MHRPVRSESLKTELKCESYLQKNYKQNEKFSRTLEVSYDSYKANFQLNTENRLLDD